MKRFIQGDRYEQEVISSKASRTQRDNLLSLKQLRIAFSEAPIDAITPQIIAQYRDKRSAKVRANREFSLLSYNIAGNGPHHSGEPGGGSVQEQGDAKGADHGDCVSPLGRSR